MKKVDGGGGIYDSSLLNVSRLLMVTRGKLRESAGVTGGRLTQRPVSVGQIKQQNKKLQFHRLIKEATEIKKMTISRFYLHSENSSVLYGSATEFP